MPVILWTYPRTISTAFERSIYMLKDQTQVLHEPLSLCYYFSSDRTTHIPGYLSMPIDTNAPTFEQQYRNLVAKVEGKKIFSKDMAYYAGNAENQRIMLDTLESIKQNEGGCDDEIIHTFLIRNPVKAVKSLFKSQLVLDIYNGQTEEEEIGILELQALYSIVVEERGQKCIVVDADDLISNPESIMRQYCELSNLTFEPQMLEWEDGDYPEEWKTWGQWHDGAKSAKGFSKSAPAKRDDAGSTVTGENVSEYLIQSGGKGTEGSASASDTNKSENVETPLVSNMEALQHAYNIMYEQRIRVE